MTTDLIFMDLIHNQSHFLNLLGNLIEQRKDLLEKEDKVFRDDIDKNFISVAKSIMLEDITKRLNVNTEDAMIVLESLDLINYLK